jgi:hypothetical protein
MLYSILSGDTVEPGYIPALRKSISEEASYLAFSSCSSIMIFFWFFLAHFSFNFYCSLFIS